MEEHATPKGGFMYSARRNVSNPEDARKRLFPRISNSYMAGKRVSEQSRDSGSVLTSAEFLRASRCELNPGEEAALFTQQEADRAAQSQLQTTDEEEEEEDDDDVEGGTSVKTDLNQSHISCK
ncbi:hypothetical protein JOB18_026508 [Solea senegalensis]|uniref:Uncharacterized protein n=1 Tax=Solea senegalensis TaxID=28829 RepID=A0AAV6QHP9_SOLSE|nr:hypothetical protein JOB18_026508 [Solea senegalensis]